MTFTPRTWVVGEVVSAATMNQEIRDQFNSMFAAWSTYTPTWTSSGTAPSLGNATMIGRYMKWGRTVLAHINLTMGSTTTYGSGDYSFSLPFNAATTGASLITSAQLLAGSVRWAGQCVIGSSASSTSAFFSTSSTDPRLAWLQATVPATLASGHQLRLTLMYEAAS